MSGWFDRNRHRYPLDWDNIAFCVKAAAEWRCEACDAPHGPSPHMLTVDHFDHDPGNLDPDNLIPLCQRCHLRRQNLYPAALTREEAVARLRGRAELERTQLSFFGVIDVAPAHFPDPPKREAKPPLSVSGLE